MKVFGKLKKTFFVIFFLTSFITYPSFSEENISDLKWINKIENNIFDQEKDKKYVLINFSASWCESCRDLEKNTYSHKNVIDEINKDFTTVKIDLSKISNSSEYISKYEISELPFIIFFDKKSRSLIKHKIVGFVDSKDFIKNLQEVKKYE